MGQGMVEAFARQTNGSSRIFIVGRNRAAAEKIFAKLPPPSAPQSGHEFVQCDATLMRNVRQATKQILEKTDKINFLGITAGIMTTKGRDEIGG